MGRRALRPIDPELDLSRHLLVAGAAARSRWTRAALFGRQAPLEIEVGSGKGLFLSAAAAGDPRPNFLGIEILAKYARFAAARLAQRELDQRPVDSRRRPAFFQSLAVADASLQAVHVYFPDPWWKARHKKRRVMNESFLARRRAHAACRAARCTFGPTWKNISTRRWNCSPHTTGLTGPHEVAEKPADHDLDYRTHFERRMRLHAAPVYRAEFAKP